MKKLAVFAAALALSGCISVFPQPGAAPQIFGMDAPEGAFPEAAKVDWTLAVTKPSASRALSGADLVLREGDNRVAYVGGAEWAEPVPGLLQRTLTAMLDRSGKIVAATSEAGARADCELQWDIYAFDAHEGSDSFSARFEAGVCLIDGRRRIILQSTQISTTGEAGGGNVRSAAAALTQAALAGAEQAGAWALKQTCEKRTGFAPRGGEAQLQGAPSVGARPALQEVAPQEPAAQ